MPTKTSTKQRGPRPTSKKTTSPTRSNRAPTYRSGRAAREARLERARSQRRKALWIRSAVISGVAVAVLGAVFLLGGHGSGSASYTYATGSPGTGMQAPQIKLPSTMGGTFNLWAQTGKTTLVYFQEGTDCEPCWTQMHDIQTDMAKFHAAGIDQVVSVTTDPLSALRQKASDEGIRIPVLSDPNLTVSHEYSANQYGMMGTMMDGHSFIVVGPTGVIEWRADYGGSPNYTMFVPDATLLRQMHNGMRA